MRSKDETFAEFSISEGFLYVAGVKIGKAAMVEGRPCLEVIDKDNRRCERRGTRFVYIDLVRLMTFIELTDDYGEIKAI